MFRIYDGREHFYQWDLDRKLIVEDPSIKEVHFCNRTDSCSLICETYVEGDFTLVNVPNILLQTNWRIHVYAYNGYTKQENIFEVVQRTKPSDYIYTETEILNYEDLEKRIEVLENNGGSGTVDLRDYAKKEDVPTKISQLTDDTGDAFGKPIARASYADEAENASHAWSSDEATNAVNDVTGRMIHETYATKAELPKTFSNLIDDSSSSPINQALNADFAMADAAGNVIQETYATKAELLEAIGEALEGEY